MSTRQAFIPRAPSCAPPSEPHPHPTETRARDADTNIFVDGNGKPRSLAAFLGHKRGAGTDTVSHGGGPTQGSGLARTLSSTTGRSFEGIRRPQFLPMTTEQNGAGMMQPQAGVGQTPRKTVGPGETGFSGPMTPVSMHRGFKKSSNKGFGNFTESQEDESASNGHAHGNGGLFMGLGGEADVHIGTGTGVGGYMRGFEGLGGAGNACGIQSNSECDMAAPVPRYVFGRPTSNPRDGGYEGESVFARPLRTLEATTEAEVGTERNIDSHRITGGAKRGMRREDMEEDGRYTMGGQPQGVAKRMKQVQQDPNEYFPISSPHIPPTPALPTLSVDVLDPSLVASSLFENFEGFVNLEDIEAGWKRWRECTTEEWLKGADELAKEYTDTLDMVKDYMTAKVMGFATMVSSVEEKRTAVDRNIEHLHKKGSIVRENASQLVTEK